MNRHATLTIGLLGMALLYVAGCAAGDARPSARAFSTSRAAAAPVRLSVGTHEQQITPINGKQRGEPVTRAFQSVTLENEYLHLTILPELGERVHQVLDKTTGEQVFHVGPIEYSGNVFTGFGEHAGGVQLYYPYYHGGNPYVAGCMYTTRTHADGSAEVVMGITHYPLLQRTTMTVSLAPGEAAFRIRYRFENLQPIPVGFNPWFNGVGTTRGDVQFILPTHHWADHWYGYNDGERFTTLYPWPIDEQGRDISYAKTVHKLSAFSYGVYDDFAALYYHELDRGFARIFDHHRMPAAKAFISYNPDGGSLPWCELWGAASHNMEDPLWLGPHEVRTYEEQWMPLHGIGGMTWANEHGAIKLGREGDTLHVGAYVTRDLGRGAVRIIADGVTVLEQSAALSPAQPFTAATALPGDADEVRIAVLDEVGRTVLEYQHFYSNRPKPTFDLPDKPWRRRTPLAKAQWEEAFTPMMTWGPWWHPPRSYAEVLADDPDNLEAQLGKARALWMDEATGLANAPAGGKRTADPTPAKLTEAQALLESLRGSDEPLIAARATVLLAIVRMNQGDYDAAARALDADALPETGLTAHLRALAAVRADDWRTARTHAGRAYALAPDATLPRLLYGIALLRTGDAAAAERILLALHEANPVEPAAIALLRDAAEQRGDADAVTTWTDKLAHLQRAEPEQYQGAMKQLDALRAGRLLDTRAIDTLSGPDLPGSAP